MRTYFSCHGGGLGVDNAMLERLWSEKKIGVHYPRDKRESPDDSVSTNPEDYPDGRVKGVFQRFNELADNGGYVCASFRNQAACLIGKVEPGTRIELMEGLWGSQYKPHEGRKAVLKTLQLSQTQHIRKESYPGQLWAGRPQRVTFVRWDKAHALVSALVDGREPEISLLTLATSQQETMCGEFLRWDVAANDGLPQLDSLLLPIGRTLSAADIVGLARDGRTIFVQVTMHHYGTAKAAGKVAKLGALKSSDEAHRVFFHGGSTQCVLENGIHVFPLQTVYERFSEKPVGQRFLNYR